MEWYNSSPWNHVLLILLLSSTAILLFLSSGRGGGSDPVASPSDLTSFSSLEASRALHQQPDRLVLQRKAKERSKVKERSTRGVEEELARARRAIRRAATSAAVSSRGNATGTVFHGEHVPLADIYRNPVAFFQYASLTHTYSLILLFSLISSRKGSRRWCTRGRARIYTRRRGASSRSSSSSRWGEERGRGTRRGPTPSSCPSAWSRWCATFMSPRAGTTPPLSASSPTTSG